MQIIIRLRTSCHYLAIDERGILVLNLKTESGNNV